MEAAKTYQPPYRVRDQADEVVADPMGLLELLDEVLS